MTRAASTCCRHELGRGSARARDGGRGLHEAGGVDGKPLELEGPGRQNLERVLGEDEGGDVGWNGREVEYEMRQWGGGGGL